MVPDPDPEPTARLISLRDGAAYLGVSLHTIRQWIRTGVVNLPVVRLGRRVLLDKTRLDALIDQRR